MATPAVPADASKPGRATNTQLNKRMLGARPHRMPVTTAPVLPNGREKKAIAAVIKMPHAATYVKNTRSPLLHMRFGRITRSKIRRIPSTIASQAHRASRCNLWKGYMSPDSILKHHVVREKSPLHFTIG